LVIIVAGLFAVASALPAAAFTSTTNGSSTLVGYNSTYFEFAYFPWTADSGVTYSEVTDGTGNYALVTNAVHEDKTNIDWTDFSSNLTGYVTTTFYAGGTYVYAWTYGNGSCLGSPWTYWFCSADNPTSFNRYYSPSSPGRGDMDAHLGIGGGGWGTYSGYEITGSFYFSY